MSKVKVRRARPGLTIYPKTIVLRDAKGAEISKLRRTPPAQYTDPLFWQDDDRLRFTFNDRGVRIFEEAET